MAITVTQLHAHLEAARAALGDDRPADGLRAARQALATLCGLPDSEMGNDRVHWRTTIETLIAQCQRAVGEARRAARGGLQRTTLTYTRPTS